MAVLQCGACDRFISVSSVPGGNPVAKADPERWSLTRKVCGGCGKSLCDRCAPASATECPLCRRAIAQPSRGAGVAGPATATADADGDDEDDDGRRRAELASARRWFVAGCIGYLMMAFGVMGKFNLNGLFVIGGLVFAVIGAWCGASGLARAGSVSRIWKFAAPLALLVPFIGVLVLPAFWWRSHAELRTVEAALRARQARAAVRQRAARRAASAPVPPSRPADAGLPAALRAIACVKFGGLTLPDGQMLQVNLGGGAPDMAPDDAPVVLAYKGFGLMFAVDQGAYFGFLNRRQVQEAEMDAHQLLQAGLGNLAGWAGGDGGPGLNLKRNGAAHAVIARGQFEASLVLLDSVWDKAFKALAPNGAVVAMPAADVLAFCDARSAEGIAELRAIVRRLEAGGARMLIRELFVRRDGGWAALA